jgi:hypothetical protein
VRVCVGPSSKVGRRSHLLGLIDLSAERGEDFRVVNNGFSVTCESAGPHHETAQRHGQRDDVSDVPKPRIIQ